jgi:anti-sigma B factor antagonist
MKFERKPAGNVTILAFTGEFDGFHLPRVSEEIDALIEKGCTRLVFNLRRLKFINSAALGYLIKTGRRLKERDGELVLSEPSAFFQTTIKTLGIDQIFRIYPDDQEAVGYFHDAGGEEGSAVDDKLRVSTPMSFRLLDAPETAAVGKILAIHEDGPMFEYPVDPGQAKIARDELIIGRHVWLKFRKPFQEKERFFEMEAEVVMSVDVDEAEGTSKYRLRYTKIDEGDRKALAQLIRERRPGDEDGTAGVAARLRPRRPFDSGTAPPLEEDTA